MLRARLFAFGLVLAPVLTGAHNDISETIKALTAEIERQPTAELYFQRATEFRALQERQHALEDLQAALELAPNNRLALIALIQLDGPTKRAKKLIARYHGFASTPAEKFEAAYLLANYYADCGDLETATSHCWALQATRLDDDPTLDLFHADLLAQLGRHQAATFVLQSAWQASRSIVVRNNWIDSALTAGQPDQVLPIIERELTNSRFRSSWLIRRARAALLNGDRTAATADLKAALAELSPRINPERPDLTLIADRGLIYALLGQVEPARQDLAQLKKVGYPASSLRLLEMALAKK